ncbi:hypothetical protein AAMO2058_000031800 [Amorphochlora amoebiformis]
MKGALEHPPPNPSKLLIPLMPHQLQALSWIQWRETLYPHGGILADDMGMGKTLTMIAMLLHEREMEMSKPTTPSLIVAPAAVLVQWDMEIRIRCSQGALKCEIFHGKGKKTDIDSLASCDVVLTSYETLHRDVSKSKSMLLMIQWDRIILDEAHLVKNVEAGRSLAVSRLNSRKRWALTGTPLQNNMAELLSLLQFLRFDPFDDPVTWSTHIVPSPKLLMLILSRLMLRRMKSDHGPDGKKLVNIPPKVFHVHYLRLSPGEQQIHDALFMESQALYDSFVNKFDTIHKGDPSWRNSYENKSPIKFFGSLVRLRQACCHPGLVKHPRLRKIVYEYTSKSPSVPAIDFDEFRFSQDPIPSSSSKRPEPMSGPGEYSRSGRQLDGFRGMTIDPHDGQPELFSKSKLQALNRKRPKNDQLELTASKQLKYHCGYPRCPSFLKSFASPNERRKGSRKRLIMHLKRKIDDVIMGGNVRRSTLTSFSAMTNSDFKSSKIEACLKAINYIDKNHPGDKVVVVSQWTSLLRKVGLFLRRMKKDFLVIDSSIRHESRKRTIADFNFNPTGIPVLLLSMMAGGVGLNLVGANHLILLDLHWNPAVEKQVCDRIYRVGQTKCVHIHKLVSNGTFEERILDLQVRKNAIFNRVIDSQNSLLINTLFPSTSLANVFNATGEGLEGANLELNTKEISALMTLNTERLN